MRIALIVEGKTETAFLPALRKYLTVCLADTMPAIKAIPQNGRIPKEGKLKLLVENLLSGPNAYDAVIALTDVYTSKSSDTRDFIDAEDAKSKMREWVGDNTRFYPHAAQHDFEAWLLPYWPTIQKIAGHNKTASSGQPENINHETSPADYLEEIFRLGKKRKYNKPREAEAILSRNDLSVAISRCPELKSLINTLLTLSGHPVLP